MSLLAQEVLPALVVAVILLLGNRPKPIKTKLERQSCNPPSDLGLGCSPKADMRTQHVVADSGKLQSYAHPGI